MLNLVLQGYLRLAQFDVYLIGNDFHSLHSKVRACPVLEIGKTPNAIEQICSALDTACIWYWKQVLCLQRSAATTCLLRLHGIPAQMVIGAQRIPFKAHAWVEVEGRVVNDKPYVHELYAMLDKF